MPPKVSIVILQYNNSQDTIRCLQTVKELKWPRVDHVRSKTPQASTDAPLARRTSNGVEVIVVDNASNPPHLENIKEYLKSQSVNCQMSIVTSSENLGYAGGNNLGIKKALKNNADYILILNNDTKVASNLIEKLIETAESDNQIGIVGPLIESIEVGPLEVAPQYKEVQPRIKLVCGGKIKWLSPELKHVSNCFKIENSPVAEQSSLRGTVKLEINEYVPGSCMLIKRQTIEKIGLLPEEYFLYFEDADYCLKAHKMGLKCAITHETAIYHQIHGSTSQLGSPLILRYHFRNSLYFNRKNGPLWARILLYPWSLWIIAKQLIKIAIRRYPKHSKVILLGVIDFYLGRTGQITSK